MKYVNPHYQYTLELLADRLVTPARYGHIALSQEVTTENLAGLWDE